MARFPYTGSNGRAKRDKLSLRPGWSGPHEGARILSTDLQHRAPDGETAASAHGHRALEALVISALEDDKAEDIVAIDLQGKSSVTDVMIIASGRSNRHVGAISDHLLRKLKEAGVDGVRAEGLKTADWVLIDAGDVIVHVFRPEVRVFYDLEKMWSAAGGVA
ncbi:MAG: ribosome silencing factor [Oceanicaulis sp.]|nr:ribosome silencing factor [Oceanicaulis sp.]